MAKEYRENTKGADKDMNMCQILSNQGVRITYCDAWIVLIPTGYIVYQKKYSRKLYEGVEHDLAMRVLLESQDEKREQIRT